MRALEAAVRLGSFTRAAKLLSLTQGAVSQHIRALEDRLGKKLFVRTTAGVQPTPVAQALALQIRQGLSVLDRAFDVVPHKPSTTRKVVARKRVVISVLPAFARQWLVPRIEFFLRRYPEIDLEIETSGTLARLDDAGGIDAAIRYGPGGWSGLEAEKLMNETVFPVVSPSYNGGKLPKRPSDLRNCILLRQTAQPWEPWFQVAGLAIDEPDRGPKFSDAALVVDAAVAGQGVALARQALVREELSSGRLVKLWSYSVVDVHAYFLVWPPTAAKARKIEEFRLWLLDEVGRWERELELALALALEV